MKTLLRLTFICSVMLCCSTLSWADESCAVSFCDLNNDGQVNCLDLIIMLNEFTKDHYSDPEDPNHPQYLMIKKYEQNALLQDIYRGLGIFEIESGWHDYPYFSSHPIANSIPDPNLYVGANILAEAMLGQDLLGFHEGSHFRSDGIDPRTGHSLYLTDSNTPIELVRESMYERVGTYLDLDEIKVFRLQDIYEDVGGFNGSSLVLCDVYEKTRHSGIKTGMPILYYKARREFINQDYTDAEGIENDIYYYPDNQALLELGTAGNTVLQHPLGDGIDDLKDFEHLILDERITVVKRPHRSDSYILISAGPDGLYGTADDVCNF